MLREAEISDCGLYRWSLSRCWDSDSDRIVAFVMLNPSTADAAQDDATIRRCISFAQSWGFAGLWVRNLFPYRATDPKDLEKACKRGIDIRGGQRGLDALVESAQADLIIAAWGAYPCTNRAAQFLEAIAPAPVWCLGRTSRNRGGAPRHPLYLPNETRPMPYLRCEGKDWQ
jgi:hypothetical protein